MLEQNLQDIETGTQEDNRQVLPETLASKQGVRRDYITENQEKHKFSYQSDVKQQPRSTAKVTSTISVHNEHQQTKSKNAQSRPQTTLVAKNQKSANGIGYQYDDERVGSNLKQSYGRKSTEQIRATPTLETRVYGREAAAAAFDKSSKQVEDRQHSRSFDKGQGGRPRSAHKERSRDYGNTLGSSHYSSVYSRILNSGEVNKIRKLVGEQNSDLDV